jgi:3-oxoacyl-[acyl-carrier-protein] synthase-3
MSKIRAAITSISHWVPDKVLTNKDLEKIVDTNDEWIVTRTGIKERRVLDKELPTSYMGIKAANICLERRGISAEEIDFIIVASVTPDMWFPSTACIIQDAIGAKNAWGFDILAACSSFLFALSTGAKMIESGAHKKVLVVGADKMTSIADYTDRNTCILFGDAAGCALLEPAEDENFGIMDEILHIDGRGQKHLYMMAGGSLNPPSHETVDKKWHYVYQDGQAVFKDAVKGMADISVEIMKKNNLKAEDISYLVPHQANMRILSSTANRMGISQDKVMVNIHKYGNTTAATIPSCISEYWEEGKVKKGDNLILSAFGAGYTWGAIWLKWAY